jgi:hypothetical protein
MLRSCVAGRLKGDISNMIGIVVLAGRLKGDISNMIGIIVFKALK